MCNPNWGPKMEEQFRAQLSEQGYIHEILADFGSQETGVFNKDRLDQAMQVQRYTYTPLTYSQRLKVEQNEWDVEFLIPPNDLGNRTYMRNPFRTMGIDWDLRNLVPIRSNTYKTTK